MIGRKVKVNGARSALRDGRYIKATQQQPKRQRQKRNSRRYASPPAATPALPVHLFTLRNGRDSHSCRCDGLRYNHQQRIATRHVN